MLSKIEFRPGVAKDDTPLASDPGYVDSDKIRFWRGRPQSIGGWSKLASDPFPGIARGAHDWGDNRGRPYLAWGTAANLYVLVEGQRVDITPPLFEAIEVVLLTTNAGSPVVKVTLENHGLIDGDIITFRNASLINGININGSFPIIAIDKNSYQFVGLGNAGGVGTNISSATLEYKVAFRAGLVDYSATDTPRIWSLDNFGENLLAVPRGLGLYEWQPPPIRPFGVLNGGFDADTNWRKGSSGWTISGGKARKSAGSAGDIAQAFDDRIVPGRMYRLSVTVEMTAGTLRFQFGPVTVGSSDPTVVVGTASTLIRSSGTYSRLFRAPPEGDSFQFLADNAFNGTIDDVAIVQETRAYRIDEAPQNIDYMFVEPNRFVVALSTQEFDGDFNPLTVRWSDIENRLDWSPLTDGGVSGELTVGGGGAILAGIATRQQNILFTESSAFSLTFTGDSSVFSLRLLGTGCGLIGRQAAVDLNGTVFWMGRGSFYAFQGSIPQKLDCSLERDVFDHLLPENAEKVYAGVASEYNEIWWLYPDTRDGVECSRVVVYNVSERTWWTHRLDRTSFLSGDNFPRPIAFSATGQVYEHEVGFSGDGQPIGWSLTTSAFDVEDGENLMLVKSIVPDFEDQQGNVNIALTTRLYPNAADFNPWSGTAEPATQVLRMRRKGRQFSMTLSSQSNPSFFRMGAVRLDAEKAGAKR